MFVTLTRTFRFEAARRLPTIPADHPCAHVHGHGFVVELSLSGEVDPVAGWLIDYGVIADAWESIRPTLDHRYLNDVPGLENPTSEHLARWIWRALEPRLAPLDAVAISETPDTRCVYRGDAATRKDDR